MDLEGENIIMFSLQRWDTHFTCIHGTALRLAQRNRVLFMEPPESIAKLPFEPAARRSFRHMFRRLETFGASLGIYHTPPLFLPMQARSKLILRTVNATYHRMIRDGLRRMRMSMDDTIFWIYQFNLVGLVEAINPKLAIYECVEEAAEFTPKPRLRNYVKTMDSLLCRRADLVIVPNNILYETRQAIAREIHMLPWAADIEHYNQSMDPNLRIPDDISGIHRPIIGFCGNIDPCRFDVELMLTLARRHPEWSIVLIGRLLATFDPRPLQQAPNIHLLSMKPLEELPAYIKAFDVCTIPYVMNSFTRSITPLKLMEYLATGKPVVTTALPAALMYPEVLRIAATHDEFEAHVVDALDDPLNGIKRRLAVAQENNWNHYMKHKTAIVAAHLNKGDVSRTLVPSEV